jgi:hypothetical protein
MLSQGRVDQAQVMEVLCPGIAEHQDVVEEHQDKLAKGQSTSFIKD